MLTSEHIQRRLTEAYGSPMPPLERVCFGPNDFERSDSEETIRISFGSRQHFPDVVLFLIKTLQADGLEHPALLSYPLSMTWEPITEDKFLRTVYENSYRLARTQPLPSFVWRRCAYAEGWLLYNEWNDRMVLAEYEDGYLAFHWDTTA